eukprot:scaffold24546_cov35-Tisochrysis_lutea.AAC.2
MRNASSRERKRTLSWLAPPISSPPPAPSASLAAERMPGASATARPRRIKWLQHPSSGACSVSPSGASSDHSLSTLRPR